MSSSRSNKSSAKVQATARQPRTDGDLTRSGILEAAGELFGERGYDGATGKAICERAGVNMAAINYHFGGRDGLYLAVLKEVQQRIMGTAPLQEIVQGTLPPDEKLRQFLRALLGYVVEKDHWPLRLWAREVIAPSPLFDQLIREEMLPKFDMVAELISEITGLPVKHRTMPQLVLQTVSPCMTLLIAGRDRITPFQHLFRHKPNELADRMWVFVLAGLQAGGPNPASP